MAMVSQVVIAISMHRSLMMKFAMSLAINRALKDADISPKDIDLVCVGQ
jgi:3-oxoacyl-[acyl-carrier-protein] synthase III